MTDDIDQDAKPRCLGCDGVLLKDHNSYSCGSCQKLWPHGIIDNGVLATGPAYGPQKSPSSVAKVQAEARQAMKQATESLSCWDSEELISSEELRLLRKVHETASDLTRGFTTIGFSEAYGNGELEQAMFTAVLAYEKWLSDEEGDGI